MQQSSYPTKIPLPWASGATSSYINSIPTPSQQSTDPKKASFTDGFPPGTFGASGSPPYGQDFNGVLNQISAGLQAAQAGAVPQYDATFAAAIGGYPKGCILASTTFGLYWVSTADGNTTNPDSSGSNWQSLFLGLAPLASPPFTGSPTSPTPSSTANNTQIATTAWVRGYSAALAGSSSQGFSVANATASTQAVPLGQAQTIFAAINGSLAQPFSATAFTAQAGSGLTFSGSTGSYYMDAAGGAVKVPVGGSFYVEDTTNTLVPAFVGNATASNHALPLGQAQSTFAKLAGLASQLFSVATPSATDSSNSAANTSWVTNQMQRLVTSVISAVATATGFAFVGTASGWYMRFPSWLGGWIVQGGVVNVVGGTRETGITFPLAFPNSYFNGYISEAQATSPFVGANPTIYGVSPGSNPKTGMVAWGLVWNGSGWSSPTSTIVANWLAIGY